MISPGRLKQLARGLTERELDGVLRHHGVAATGIVCTGVLEVVTEFLTSIVGPEAAYATLQSFADHAAAPVLAEHVGDVVVPPRPPPSARAPSAPGRRPAAP